MAIRHLRYFVAAAEFGTFRKSAAALGVQESTISRAIRDLEDRLGACLFLRHLGGVEPIIAGRRLLQRSHVALEQTNLGAQEVAVIGCRKEGHLKVGVFPMFGPGFLSELVALFEKTHAGVQVDFVERTLEEHELTRFDGQRNIVKNREAAIGLCDVPNVYRIVMEVPFSRPVQSPMRTTR